MILTSRKESKPDAAVESQQIAANREETGPKPGINAPFQAVGTVKGFAAFTIESDDGSLNVLKFALLSA